MFGLTAVAASAEENSLNSAAVRWCWLGYCLGSGCKTFKIAYDYFKI